MAPKMTVEEVLVDPEFLGLPTRDRFDVLNAIDPDFRGLPTPEKGKVMKQLTPPDVEEPSFAKEVVGGTALELGEQAVGGVEAAANTLGGFVEFVASGIPSGIAGLATYYKEAYKTGDYQQSLEKATAEVEEWQEWLHPYLTWEPKTEAGKTAQATIAKTLDFFVGTPLDVLGQKTTDVLTPVTGPNIAAGVGTGLKVGTELYLYGKAIKTVKSAASRPVMGRGQTLTPKKIAEFEKHMVDTATTLDKQMTKSLKQAEQFRGVERAAPEAPQQAITSGPDIQGDGFTIQRGQALELERYQRAAADRIVADSKMFREQEAPGVVEPKALPAGEGMPIEGEGFQVIRPAEKPSSILRKKPVRETTYARKVKGADKPIEVAPPEAPAKSDLSAYEDAIAEADRMKFPREPIAPRPEYAVAKKKVGGLTVRDNVPNTDSIHSSLTDYEVLDGVKEIPIKEFDAAPRDLFYAADDLAKVRKLTKEIKKTKEINPLIVVEDAEGLYVLEGAHRLGALHEAGVKNVPAVVVRDLGQPKPAGAIKKTAGKKSTVKLVGEIIKDINKSSGERGAVGKDIGPRTPAQLEAQARLRDNIAELRRRGFKSADSLFRELRESETYKGITRADVQNILDEKLPALAKVKAAIRPKEDYGMEGGALKVLETTREAHEVSLKKQKLTAAGIRDSLVRKFVDVSGNFKRELLKWGAKGKEVVMRHDLIAGSHTKGIKDFAEISDRIYKSLTHNEHDLFDAVIAARRIIAIGKYKPGFKFQRGLTPHDAQNFMDKIPSQLREKMKTRADLYFAKMREQLDLLHERGLITEEAYNDLVSKGDYSPREVLKHIDPDRTYSIDSKKITVPDSGIRNLKEGSVDLIETDSSLLLSNVIVRTQMRLFRQRANEALYDLAKSHPDNGMVKVAQQLGTTKAGAPKYSPTPTGYERIALMIDGKRQDLFLENKWAKEWILRDPALDSQLANMMGWLSGAKILRPMATGLNPEFAITNFPRDIAHEWLTTEVFSPHAPIAALQVGRSLAATAKDAWLRRGVWNDYINEGGGMEFLTHQGRFGVQGAIGKIQSVLGYLGESSEIWTRLALRDQAMRNGLTSTEATWEARNYLDFSQGGSYTKALDSGIPYLSASVQGSRGVFRAAARNPKLFTYKVAQIGTLATGLYLANKHINPEAWEQISDRDKVSNWIITTPFLLSQMKMETNATIILRLPRIKGKERSPLFLRI